MATIRKLRRKWQAIVRKKKIHVIKSFLRKGDATKWAYKVEAQIETGSYNFQEVLSKLSFHTTYVLDKEPTNKAVI